MPVVPSVFDVTAGNSVEQQLVRSQTLLAGLVDQASDAIISIDEQQRIILFNRGAEAIFGYAAAEVIGRPLELLLPEHAQTAHARHVEAFGDGLQSARRMGERSEISGRRKDGSEFPAEASIARLDSADGPVFTAILRDVTDRKQQQILLEARVAERTRELQAEIGRREAAQAALAQAQRMDALGQLTGGVAHDSNNLLTVISGNLEMIEDELGDHPAMKYVREAQEAAKMGARLNQRLLTFSRRRKLAAEIVNLNDQVLAMSELLRRALGENINIATLLGHDLWPTRVDPSEIENAILNLAINARDAMPGGGDLRIETRNMTIDDGAEKSEDGLGPGDYVHLAITDTGVGMTPDVLRRVFEPFFTTKGAAKGSGLGLSTLYGFVRQSNGHVEINSEVGRGTTVNVYLPRASGAESPAGRRVEDEQLPLGHGELILVVEDNPQVRRLAAARLDRLGYRVIEAENGPAALAVLAQEAGVSLVFSDVVMPGGMSGFDLAERIAERAPDLPVVLTSGFAADAARAGDHGHLEEAVLRKPYSLAQLAESLGKALAQARAAGQSRVTLPEKM